MRAKFTWALCVGIITLGLSGGTAVALDPNESLPPKTPGHALSIDELRYCEFQSVRLEAGNAATDHFDNNAIGAFNRAVDDWNARCGDGRYRVRDKARIDGEILTQRQRLAAEGGNPQLWIQSRDANAYYVDASTLNLRVTPTTNARVVRRLDQFATVYASGEEVNGWLPVTIRGDRGFVSMRFVRRGSGGPARRAHCTSIAGPPPVHGEIFYGLANGPHTLEVTNGLNVDAIVKLKRPDDRTVISFYVDANRTWNQEGVPEGHYQLMFATGNNFSRGCNRFTDKTSLPTTFVDLGEFTTTYSGNSQYLSVLTVTLQPVDGGHARTQTLDDNDADFWVD